MRGEQGCGHMHMPWWLILLLVVTEVSQLSVHESRARLVTSVCFSALNFERGRSFVLVVSFVRFFDRIMNNIAM